MPCSVLLIFVGHNNSSPEDVGVVSQVVKEMGQYASSMADVYFDVFKMGDPYSVFQVSPPQRRITSACPITVINPIKEGLSAVLSPAFVLLKIDFKRLPSFYFITVLVSLYLYLLM